MKIATDQGWAWAVAFAGCWINMVMSGLSRSVAMLYVEVINKYEVTRQSATIPFSVRNSVRCITGPLVGLTGQHFEIRSITFWGGVLSSIGGISCSVSPNIFWLTISWGIITGLGFAFGNTLYLVVINQYFKKHRTTACGIALSGGAIGSLLFPLIIEALLTKYDLAGVFLLLGGVTMQVLPASLIMRSPPWCKVGKKENEETRSRSLRAVSFTGSCTDVAPPLGTEENSANTNKAQKLTLDKILDLDAEKIKNPKQPKNNSNHLSPPVDPFAPKEERNGNRGKNLKHKNAFVASCISFLKLYVNPLYILLNVCMGAYCIILILVSTIIVDYGNDKGLSVAQGKYLIMATAIGDVIGRLCFGWITDKKFLSPQNYVLIMFILQGVAISLIPVTQSFTILLVLLTIFGTISGSTMVRIATLVLKYVAASEQPLAMSCVNTIAGVVSFAMPSFIGYFRDDVGSYNGLFYVAGGVTSLCGIFWFSEPFLKKFVKLESEGEKRTTQTKP